MLIVSVDDARHTHARTRRATHVSLLSPYARAYLSTMTKGCAWRERNKVNRRALQRRYVTSIARTSRRYDYTAAIASIIDLVANASAHEAP